MANQFKPITQEDIDFIHKNVNTMTGPQIAKAIGRSYSFVYKELNKIKEFETITWKDEEVTFIKENYLIMTYPEMSKKVNRSVSAIQCQLRKLGLAKDDNSKPWTKEEDEHLRARIDEIGYTELAKEMTRSVASIAKRARRLGLVDPQYTKCRKLRKAQQMFIAENAMKYTDAEFADMFAASIEAIEECRKKLGIVKTGNEIKGKTYIERKIANYLEELEVQYDYDIKVDNYRLDFLIKDTKIVIEVHGDYWHCNPLVYGDGPKDDIQIRHIVRDYYKKCYLLSRNYILIEVWELDINNNWDAVKEKIKSAVLG